jgi:cytochrome c oxidase subunit IV
MSAKAAWQIWRKLCTIWLALFVLLAITVGSAYLPLGAANGAINLGVAAAKTALIALFFMNLLMSSVLVRLAAAAGMFWLVFLFALTAGDYLTR